ncbi:MAG: hypothetical protein KDI21_09520 [Halieaceae bacterium]|nr:hypothetical protein [Halieaceae bacterium]
MSNYLEEIKRLQAEVDALTPEQIGSKIRHVPRPGFAYTRKNPTRRNLPNWLEDQGRFLQDHYREATESGVLEPDLDTDGYAFEKLECSYKTALSTIYLAEDAWNHRQQNRPGTEIELALKELVHTRVDNYMREYLRHFRFRKPKSELVKAVLASYPLLQNAIADGKIANLVIAEFIYSRCGINISENTIYISLRELGLIDN